MNRNNTRKRKRASERRDVFEAAAERAQNWFLCVAHIFCSSLSSSPSFFLFLLSILSYSQRGIRRCLRYTHTLKRVLCAKIELTVNSSTFMPSIMKYEFVTNKGTFCSIRMSYTLFDAAYTE